MKALLVFVTLAGIGAVIGAVVVGTVVHDGTVVDNPYERGLSWDAERKQREASGIRVGIVDGELPRGPATLLIEAFDGSGAPVADARLAVRLFRAETDRHERTYTAVGRGDGTFAAEVNLDRAGRWKVAVLFERQGAILEFPASIYVREAP